MVLAFSNVKHDSEKVYVLLDQSRYTWEGLTELLLFWS